MSDNATLLLVSQAVNNLEQTLQNSFPQQGGLSASALAGSVALPANPAAFLTVSIGGVAYKVALYRS